MSNIKKQKIIEIFERNIRRYKEIIKKLENGLKSENRTSAWKWFYSSHIPLDIAIASQEFMNEFRNYQSFFERGYGDKHHIDTNFLTKRIHMLVWELANDLDLEFSYEKCIKYINKSIDYINDYIEILDMFIREIEKDII